jgi:uncharacterized membrane protein HdeD (DUF308 family)
MAPIIIGIIFIIFGILLYNDPAPSIYGYPVRPEVGIIISFLGIFWTIWGIINIKKRKRKK